MVLPAISSAPASQAVSQALQPLPALHLVVSIFPGLFMACPGQALTHFLHLTHLLFLYPICGAGFMHSGFWHHAQSSGQPLKKTVVLIPGPSCTENFWMSVMQACSALAIVPSLIGLLLVDDGQSRTLDQFFRRIDIIG